MSEHDHSHGHDHSHSHDHGDAGGEPPSTGFFVIFLCALLVIMGLFVMGIVPGCN